MSVSTKLDRTTRSLPQRVPPAVIAAVADLLRQVTGAEPVLVERETEIRLAAHLSFGDNIGRAHVEASLLSYRGRLRLDLWIEHDRVFARSDGSPSTNRCFLNDYAASTRLPWDATALPKDFVQGVEAGVVAARDGVPRYNSRCRSSWFRVFVAARAP